MACRTAGTVVEKKHVSFRFKSQLLFQVVLGIVIGSLSCDKAAGKPQIGAKDLDGHAVDVFAGTNKLVVLLFVSNDCPISNRYTPELIRLHRLYSSKGVSFFAVHANKDETPESIRRHAEEFHYSFPVLRDPGLDLVKRAKATVTPEAAVFRSSGELIYHGRVDNRYVALGQERAVITEHDLEQAILSGLDGKLPQLQFVPAVGCQLSPRE